MAFLLCGARVSYVIAWRRRAVFFFSFPPYLMTVHDVVEPGSVVFSIDSGIGATVVAAAGMRDHLLNRTGGGEDG